MPSEAATTHDTVRAYLGQIGHLSLLTREGEIKIAKRIELGEHAVIRAVAGCDLRVHERRALGCRLRGGALRARGVVRGGADEDRDGHWEEAERARLLRLIEGVTRIAAKRENSEARGAAKRDAKRDKGTRATARQGHDAIADALTAMRLNQRVVDGLVHTLKTAERAAAPKAVSRLEAGRVRAANAAIAEGMR